MDSKTSHKFLPHLAWIIPLVGVLIAFTTMILDHMDKANALFSGIWNYLFVNIWYIWVLAAGYGLYRFVRLIQNFHNVTNKVIPGLMTAHAEIMSRTVELIEKESKSRVSAIDTLSNRLNSIDTGFSTELKNAKREISAELAESVRKEAKERTDGINALLRELEKHFERMNKLETSLPNQMSGRIQEIEKKLTAQISALNERVKNVEPPRLTPNTKNDNITPTRPFVPTPEGLFGLGLANSTTKVPSSKGLLTTPVGLGLADSLPPAPTPENVVAEVLTELIKQKKKQP